MNVQQHTFPVHFCCRIGLTQSLQCHLQRNMMMKCKCISFLFVGIKRLVTTVCTVCFLWDRQCLMYSFTVDYITFCITWLLICQLQVAISSGSQSSQNVESQIWVYMTTLLRFWFRVEGIWGEKLLISSLDHLL